MPIFESCCTQPKCPELGRRRERYYKKEYEAPVCEVCGKSMEQLISAPNVCWARPLSFYADKKIEAEQSMKAEDGHWVWKKRSTRRVDGQPERIWVDSIQAQKEYCRDEGLVLPSEAGNPEPDSSGHVVSSRGNKGSWI